MGYICQGGGGGENSDDEEEDFDAMDPDALTESEIEML